MAKILIVSQNADSHHFAEVIRNAREDQASSWMRDTVEVVDSYAAAIATLKETKRHRLFAIPDNMDAAVTAAEQLTKGRSFNLILTDLNESPQPLFQYLDKTNSSARVGVRSVDPQITRDNLQRTGNKHLSDVMFFDSDTPFILAVQLLKRGPRAPAMSDFASKATVTKSPLPFIFRRAMRLLKRGPHRPLVPEVASKPIIDETWPAYVLVGGRCGVAGCCPT
jgi:hypothetical protein